MKKIGILQTGYCPTELVRKHGEYDQMFETFLSGHDLAFKTFPVLENVFPEKVDDADGWLITGSRFGVYEDHVWLSQLEHFIRDIKDANIPLVGVCFGHQVIAQALGGKVEKFAGGWSVGKQHYRLDGVAGGIDLMAWHQDQIIRLPKGAKTIGSSDFCQHAIVTYGETILTVQPHPEFGAEFVADLFDARKDVLPAQVMAEKDKPLAGPIDTNLLAEMMTAVFKRKPLRLGKQDKPSDKPRMETLHGK